MRIPYEFINENTNKLGLGMNKDHTFLRPGTIYLEKFHTPPLSYYLDEEKLDKEVFSWPCVKKIQNALGVSY
jgi:hypothetical protein